MRIVHIIDSLTLGGAEILLLNTIKSYKRHFPDSKHVIVVLKKAGDPQLCEEAARLGSLIDLGFRKTNLIAAAKRFRAIFKAEKTDVIHTHLLDSTLFARLFKPSHVTLVSTYHNIVYDKAQVHFSRWRLLLDKLTYRDSYYFVFVSKAVADNIREALPLKNNYQVLANFAGDEFGHAYEYNPEASLKLISIGNLKPNKNHELAVLALAQLRHLPVTLDIFGEGILREHLEKTIADTGANVRLRGTQQISSALLKQYDAFLMTSFNEGMPVSLIEALCTGLPSILNDLPMLRETAGNTALYYQTNRLDDLVATLKSVLNDKSVLKQLSQETLVVKQQFSNESYVKSLHRIYSGSA